jgi:maltose/maltodextrin transport system permease protein
MTTSQRTRIKKVAAHGFMIFFLILILVPFVMVISASLRQGNFAPSRLLPDKVSLDHWKFVLGIPYQEVVNPATGQTRTVKAGTPPLRWFWNSI